MRLAFRGQRVLVRDSGEFVESKHPRAEGGAKGGQFVAKGGGGGSSASGPAASGSTGAISHEVSTALAAKTKGSAGERNALRKLLKIEKDPAVKSVIAMKIKESYQKSLMQAQVKGDWEKVSKIQEKLKKLSPSSPYKPPSPPPAQAYVPQTPPAAPAWTAPVQKSYPPGVADTPEDKKAFDDLAAVFPGGSANSYLIHAKNSLSNNPGLAKKISAAQAAHIAAYTCSGYKEVNSQLREGMMTEQTWHHVKCLNDALDKMPPHEGPVVRKIPGNIAAKYKPGMIIDERGFTSTSTRKDWSWSGGGTLQIESKTGRSVKPLSGHPHEEEVLFKSGTKFKVVSNDGTVVKLVEA